MANNGTIKWSSEDVHKLELLHSTYSSSPNKWKLIAKELNRSAESCRSYWRTHGTRNTSESQEKIDIHNTSRIEYSDDSIYVVQASRRVMSQEELMEAYNIEPSQWRVEKYIIRTSEGYRKDRKVSWHVRDGQVITGDVEDSGKMLVVPLYHMELRLVRKQEEIRARNAIEELIQDAKTYAPKQPKIKYRTNKDSLLYEIAMPDIHFGRLTWHEESGLDFDIKIAEDVVMDALSQLLQFSTNFNVGKILFPVGNDFFNVNNKANTTSKGTPQQEDTRWQKTFRAGRILMTKVIDACAEIAPVDILLIPGNHDEEKAFYLGDALECWYHNNKNVFIDNTAISRKYYSYGKVLLGFTHGHAETIKKLPNIMQFEVPKLWGDSVHREWHTGDKHHKTDFVLEVDEQVGIVIRILRSLVPSDAWTFNHGFVGSQKAAEAFMWHPDKGLLAQFNAKVSDNKYYDKT